MKKLKVIILLCVCLFLIVSDLPAFSRKDSLIKLYRRAETVQDKYDRLSDIIDYQLTIFDKDNLTYLNIADSLVRANNMKKEEGLIALQYVRFWNRFDSRNIATEKAYEAIRIFSKLDDPFHIGVAHRLLGETYRPLNHDSTIKHLNIAYRLFTGLNDSLYIGKTLNRYAAIYFEEDEFDKSLDYAYKALEYLDGKDDEGFIANTYIILIANYRDMGKIDSAEHYVQLALDKIKLTKDLDLISSLYINIARLYHRENKPELIIKHINEFLAYCKSIDMPESYVSNIYFYHNLYILLAEAYQKIGDYQKAYEALLNTSWLTNNITDLELQKDVMRQHYLHQSKIKENEIEYQKSLLQYQLTIFIVSFIFVVIIIIILLKRHRDMKKIQTVISNQNQQLLDQNEKLNQLNLTKDKLFSIIAHDLKNPIGSFKQVSVVLSDDYDKFSEEERKDFLKDLKESSINLANLLDNLLVWSRSQRGTIKCELESINLNMIISYTLSHLKTQADEKNIELENNIPKDVDALVDTNMMSTIIRNLVSNAIKYSYENSKIEVNYIPTENDPIVEVKDYGIGIDEEKRENLFKLGSSNSTSGTHGEQGTGLGLIVCKEFVEAQGGTIRVKSNPDKGSSFQFTIKQ